jgi:anti-sigma-K factor RskA
VSDRAATPDPPDCGLDAAPYVLGALEPEEARAFVRHLEDCAVCRDEVAALAPVLEGLPASAPARPVRAAFRRRMLRAVRAEPKTPAPGPHRRPVTPRRSAPAGWLALGLAVAAAALVVQLGGSHPVRTRAISASVGSAVLRVYNGGHGELIIRHLPALPADRVYELWLEPRGRTPRPSTLFAVSARGGADIGVPGDLHGVGRLLVTVEPRGGSLVPTTRPLIVERLAAA